MSRKRKRKKIIGNQKLLMLPRTNQKAFYRFISRERSNFTVWYELMEMINVFYLERNMQLLIKFRVVAVFMSGSLSLKKTITMEKIQIQI